MEVISRPHTPFTSREVISDSNLDEITPAERKLFSDLRLGCMPLGVLALPPGSRLVDSQRYSEAPWSRAARVTLALANGTEESYFLKCSLNESGNAMIRAEFASIAAINEIAPGFAPIPYRKGAFRDGETTVHFFLEEFLRITVGKPSPGLFCRRLADMHMNSESPTGKFGFHLTTFQGPWVHDNTWEDSWCVFFKKLIKDLHDQDIKCNGLDQDIATYEQEFETLMTRTIPQILEPLQSDGRVLKPSLVHADLWDQNTATEVVTGQPKIFDAGVFYGHNEYDLSHTCWGEEHLQEYLRNVPPSKPRRQWADRHQLYMIRCEIANSAGWPLDRRWRRASVFEKMVRLNDKYCRDRRG